jgi:hypothetical protein
MEAQMDEIEKYKWIESEKAGHDLGNGCCIEWISKYAKKFYTDYYKRKV